jgi:putative ABC transport system permease protein
VLGLGLAFIGIKVLLAINPPNIPRMDEINIDGRVLGFTLLMAILTGIIFGLIPALQATKPDLNETLKSEGARGSTGGLQKQFVRSLLVILEVAMTVFPLICAGLMIKSFLTLQNVKPGFNPDNVMTVQVNLPASKYTSKQAMASFYDRVLKRLETLPGAEAVGASLVIPLMDRRTSTRFTIDGRPLATPDERPVANFRPISHNYLRAMGIAVLSGRAFTEQDRDQSPPVIIINDSLRRRYFPGEDPVGKHLTRTADKISREIVGVVADARDTDLKDADPGPALYTPYQQTPYPFMGLAVRTSVSPESLTSAIRSAVNEIDSAQPIYDVKTMRQRVDEAVSQPRLYATLIGVFAGVALALAAVGIYGVLNYSVNQRRQEIGIRMALGAQPGHILKMIVGQGMTMAAIGLVIGVMLAYFLTRYLAGLLYGVGVNDLTIFIGIPLLLAMVSLLSCYFPARRATKVEPMIALRAE